MVVFHLADPDCWRRARAEGAYRWSTRGLLLSEVGFVHCATAEQWAGVRERFYADVTSDLVLLAIDVSGLPVRWEPAMDGEGGLFPHVYGEIPVAAVVSERRLSAPHGST